MNHPAVCLIVLSMLLGCAVTDSETQGRRLESGKHDLPLVIDDTLVIRSIEKLDRLVPGNKFRISYSVGGRHRILITEKPGDHDQYFIFEGMRGDTEDEANVAALQGLPYDGPVIVEAVVRTRSGVLIAIEGNTVGDGQVRVIFERTSGEHGVATKNLPAPS